MRTVIIVGRQNSVARIFYDSVARKASAVDYQSVVPEGTQGETRINNLAVVVRTLEQLQEKGISEEKEPTMIYTVGMVVDSINKGTFKYWLKNGGKKLDGTAVNTEEMDLWTRFAELYKDMFVDVAFKDVKDGAIPKNPRFQVTKQQRIDAEYIQKAWDRVKVTTPEIDETEGEAI
jgi:hypothetical protein